MEQASVIRFSQVDESLKEQLLYAIAVQNPKLARCDDGTFVAAVRLPPAAVALLASGKALPKPPPSPLSPEKRMEGLRAARRYKDLVRRIAESDDASAAECLERLPPARSRGDLWVLRRIDEVYDYRYSFEDVRHTKALYADLPQLSAELAAKFPLFVEEFFRKKYGIRKLVVQSCWDFACALESCRRRHIWADIFARMLDGTYSSDTVRFFVVARQIVIAEEGHHLAPSLGASGSYAAAASPWRSPIRLSLERCYYLASVVFRGLPALLSSFPDIVDSFLTRHPQHAHDSLELCELFHIVAVEHHSAFCGPGASPVPAVAAGPSASASPGKASQISSLETLRGYPQSRPARASSRTPTSRHPPPAPRTPLSGRLDDLGDLEESERRRLEQETAEELAEAYVGAVGSVGARERLVATRLVGPLRGAMDDYLRAVAASARSAGVPQQRAEAACSEASRVLEDAVVEAMGRLADGACRSGGPLADAWARAEAALAEAQGDDGGGDDDDDEAHKALRELAVAIVGSVRPGVEKFVCPLLA
eukprot:m51a1_g12480 hypothetical protein (537) ;mRNA; f:172-2641